MTSTEVADAVVGAEGAAEVGAGADCAVGAAAAGAAAAEDEWPNIADMMFPKILIAVSPRLSGYTTGDRPPSTLIAQPVT